MNIEDLKKSEGPTRLAFSKRMVEHGEIDKEFAVFDSDIGFSTYTNLFGDKYPNRYFNLGIAEVGTMSAAAGMANSGRTVVVGGYGVFLTMRALEVIRSFICYPKLNVKILSSHGGVTAAIDGVTHQATEDIAFMSTIPNMNVLVPADDESARKMFDISMENDGPFFTRLMRETFFNIYDETDEFKLGGSHILKEGSDVTIVAYGDMVFQAIEAAKELEAQGVSAEVIDMYSVKPFDAETIEKSIAKTGALLVAENHQINNGLGSQLASHCMTNGLNVKFGQIALKNTFAESGQYSQVLDKYDMSSRAIIEKTQQILGK
jgi:transketolase